MGWSSSDSPLEQLLWKISSLLIAIIPVILALEVLTLFKLGQIVADFMRYSTSISYSFIYAPEFTY